MSEPLFEVLDWVDTDLGTLCLRRRALLARPGSFVTEVTLANELLMSSLNTVSEEALSARALEWHGPGARRVLVGGLGLAYTAKAALAHPGVEYVRVIEHLPAVIGWLRDGKLPLSDSLDREPRLELVQGDVYGTLLGEATERWDAILIDVDHSPSEPLGPSGRSFHTPAGLRAACRHLNPDGVLAIWSAERDAGFEECLDLQFGQTRVLSIPWENSLVDDGEMVEDVLFLARGPKSAGAPTGSPRSRS